MRIRWALLTALWLPLLFACPALSQVKLPQRPVTDLPGDLVATLRSYGIFPTPSGLAIGLRNPSRSAQLASLVGLGRIGRYEQLSVVMNLADARYQDAAGKEVRRTAILTAIQIAKRTGGISRINGTRLLSSAREVLAEANSPLARLLAVDMLGKLGDASQYQIVLDSLKAKDLVSRALLTVRTYSKLPASAYGGKPVDWVSSVNSVLLDKASSSSDRTNAVLALADIGSPAALATLRDDVKAETDHDIKSLMIYVIRRAEAKARGDELPGHRSSI